jgi:hypothetical protein
MSFSQLPDELIFMICEKLVKVKDLVALSSSSKRLNFICKDVNYYHRFRIFLCFYFTDKITITIPANVVISFTC